MSKQAQALQFLLPIFLGGLRRDDLQTCAERTSGGLVVAIRGAGIAIALAPDSVGIIESYDGPVQVNDVIRIFNVTRDKDGSQVAGLTKQTRDVSGALIEVGRLLAAKVIDDMHNIPEPALLGNDAAVAA